MRSNLDAMHGFVYAEALTMALAGTLGKAAAHARVEALCRRAQSRGETLQQALGADAELSKAVPAEIVERIFEPSSQFGSAGTIIERALDAWRNKES